jgi:hypothetical protein
LHLGATKQLFVPFFPFRSPIVSVILSSDVQSISDCVDLLFRSVLGRSSDVNLFIVGLFVFHRLTHLFFSEVLMFTHRGS